MLRTEFTSEGRVASETWVTPAGKTLRKDGPAYTQYREDGTVARRYWFEVPDQMFRAEGPAWVEYDTAGDVVEERWYRLETIRDPRTRRAHRRSVRFCPTCLESPGRGRCACERGTLPGAA